ncbi:uncharacterized protein LOC128253892 [Drosophila gunungcola]|uniref:Uncharacterized protein n=1 Tax=Drosophila gunungcola TaxID=103775 RepID=A0A9Q0BQB5_9MUSC|nr:uncharacterized protein LOC128253892 [Drosophila gunungcola]KAI8039980.1 hypothetical protein M5D96_007405 [Drosophila gunungcola]
MFKIAICLLALASGCLAASIGQVDSTTEKIVKEIIPVLKFETEKSPDGSFHFSYEGADQSMRQEQGTLENAGTEDEALEVSGMYSYIDADGNTVEVHYTAGKNGFVPVGTIIPKEITELARAAADLPKVSAEDELKFRKARSQELEKKEEAVVAKESMVVEKSEPVPAESQVVPVQVVLDAVPETEVKTEVKTAIVADAKVETKTA